METYKLLLVLLGLLGCVQGWHLMMKVPQGSSLGSAHSVYDLWTSNDTLHEDAENVMAIQPGKPYKSADILDWNNKHISLVKIAFYKGLEEVAHIVFSAAGAGYNHSSWPVFTERANLTSWFDCSRLMYSTFSHLEYPSTVPEFCSIHSESTLQHSFSVLSAAINSQSDCDNATGWFMVMEPASSNSAISCSWKPGNVPPYFLYSPGNTSVHLQDAESADVLAVYVDDCIDESVCHSPSCWQDPLGDCKCHGYKCTEACSRLPCPDYTTCVTNPANQSLYTCHCMYGSDGNNNCKDEPGSDGISGGVIAAIVISFLVVIALCILATCCFFKWRNRKQQLKDEVSNKAGIAKDFVRRSVTRLSGRNHQFSRRHLKEEKASPPIPDRKAGKSEQLSPDSSVVFGETNPAFQDDDGPPTPQPTPPIDRRYTEFPTRSVAPPSVSVTEIQMHETKQMENKMHLAPVRRYENVQLSQSDVRLRRESPQNLELYDRASTIGSLEKASTMSEMSDATSTSGYSDYTADTPANLPPSEMISKDIMPRYHGHHRHKARSRPRSRASTSDAPPKLMVAPETMEGQINYARSRHSISSMSSLSSEATHKSDSTQRSGELTKSDVLRARYEHVMNHHGEPAGRLSRLDYMNKIGEGPSYQEIKRQLDADRHRREARERKQEMEIEQDEKYEAEKAKKHRMRQVESLDSGIDAEQASAERSNDGKIHIQRTRSADQLDQRDLSVSFSAKEATV